MSPDLENAIADLQRVGRALLKYISPNDAGLTGSHQTGFYLPQSAWRLFTPHSPDLRENLDTQPRIVWPNGLETESRITWYGASKREYRLTRFGRDFPYLRPDYVGALFVLIPFSLDQFHAYLFDMEEDISELLATLGVEIHDRWAIYSRDTNPPETTADCVAREMIRMTTVIEDFPTTQVMSAETRRIVELCQSDFDSLSIDERLMILIEREYQLFRAIEEKLSQERIQQGFSHIDEFLSVAQTILQRRKSRAGKSLEHHVARLLFDEGIPFQPQATVGTNSRPDLLIPSKAAYDNPNHPIEKLWMLALKTTCKDRWSQVMEEADRLPLKHLLTLQRGISPSQLKRMYEVGVRLIVPAPLHSEYPKVEGIRLLTVAEFVEMVRQSLAS